MSKSPQHTQTDQTALINWIKDFNEHWREPWHQNSVTGEWIGPMPLDEDDRKQLLSEAKTRMKNGQRISMNYMCDLE